MPANFDLFSTAVMLKAVEQGPRIYTFLSDSFAADGGLCDDERALYDYRKGAETGLAPFVVPGTGGVAINREATDFQHFLIRLRQIFLRAYEREDDSLVDAQFVISFQYLFRRAELRPSILRRAWIQIGMRVDVDEHLVPLEVALCDGFRHFLLDFRIV